VSVDTYDELSFADMHGEHDSQDWKDGRALRRLREATENSSVGFRFVPLVHIHWDDPDHVEPGGFSVEVRGERAYGVTIAEAADKVREALG
jgi:hypothetical protein